METISTIISGTQNILVKSFYIRVQINTYINNPADKSNMCFGVLSSLIIIIRWKLDIFP